MEDAAEFAGVDVDPADDLDSCAQQAALPGSAFEAGAPEGDLGSVGEKTSAQVVQFAGAKGGRAAVGGGAGQAGGAVAPEQQLLRQAGKLDPPGGQAQPEVIVFGPAQIAIAAGSDNQFPPEHDRGVGKGGFDIEIAQDGCMVKQLVLPGGVGSQAVADLRLGEVADAAGDQADLRPLPQQGNLTRKPLGMADVVAVHAGYQRRSALLQPKV